MLFKRLGLYSPASIPLPSKADLTDRLDTIFSSFINTVQQSHISVPVALWVNTICYQKRLLFYLTICKSVAVKHCLSATAHAVTEQEGHSAASQTSASLNL